MKAFSRLFNSPNIRAIAVSLGFPFGFLVLYLAFDHGYGMLADESLDFFFHNPFTMACVRLIKFISPDEGVVAVQNTLLSSKGNLSIVRTCDGADGFFMICAAIAMFPSSLYKKTQGLLLAFAVTILLNVCRITGLYFLKAYLPDWFEPAHVDIAPIIMLSINCAVFAFWLCSVKGAFNGKC